MNKKRSRAAQIRSLWTKNRTVRKTDEFRFYIIGSNLNSNTLHRPPPLCKSLSERNGSTPIDCISGKTTTAGKARPSSEGCDSRGDFCRGIFSTNSFPIGVIVLEGSQVTAASWSAIYYIVTKSLIRVVRRQG